MYQTQVNYTIPIGITVHDAEVASWVEPWQERLRQCSSQQWSNASNINGVVLACQCNPLNWAKKINRLKLMCMGVVEVHPCVNMAQLYATGVFTHCCGSAV